MTFLQKLNSKHKLFGKISAIAWWAGIPLFVIHLVYYCAEPNLDLRGYRLILDSPAFLRVEIIVWWSLKIALYALFGFFILRQKLGKLFLLSSAGLAGIYLDLFLTGAESNIALTYKYWWFMLMLWIVAAALYVYIQKSMRLTALLLFAAGLIALPFLYLRSITVSGEYWLFELSFLIQDLIRIVAIFFFGLWLLTLETKVISLVSVEDEGEEGDEEDDDIGESVEPTSEE